MMTCSTVYLFLSSSARMRACTAGAAAAPDVGADLPHALHGFPLRILERPIADGHAREHGALVAAAHRDQKATTRGQLSRQELRLGRREIDPDLFHGSEDFRVHLFAGG